MFDCVLLVIVISKACLGGDFGTGCCLNVLNNQTYGTHNEMEYFTPAKDTPSCQVVYKKNNKQKEVDENKTWCASLNVHRLQYISRCP